MSRTPAEIFRCLAAAAMTLVLLAAASSVAAAAPPVAGARYVADASAGFGFNDYKVKLQVARSGRWLVPGRSSIALPHWECGGLSLTVRRRLPIRDGRFSLDRRGAGQVRLRGRFTTRNTVRLRIGWRPDPDGQSLSCGERHRAVLLLERLRPTRFRDCRTHSGREVAEGPTGRVFYDREYTSAGWEDVVYACLFSENRRVVLDSRFYRTDDADFTDFRIAGPYAAWEQFECGGLACPDWWTVADLRTGEHLWDLPGGTSDLELKENGSVGILTQRHTQWPAYVLQVWAYDTAGERLLDEGNIDPNSLTLDGSTLSWNKDGVRMSAVLG